MVTLGYLAAKSCKFLHQFFLQICGRHFESAAMNGTCLQDPTEFIELSISPKFVPLLMAKDLLHKIFVLLRGIKQELYAKSFQVEDIHENLPPMLKTHEVNLRLDVKDSSRDLHRLEVHSKLRSKTPY